MSRRPVPRAFPLNAFVGTAFALAAVAALVQHAWLETGMWACFALAFLTVGADSTAWERKPVWRRGIAVTSLALGLVALIARIVISGAP